MPASFVTRRGLRRALLPLLLCLPVLPASAGVYGDELARCVVSSTTSADKAALVEWMFFVIALNPDIAPLAQIPAERREASDRGTARLFERLLTDSCVAQSRDAVKYEGSTAIRDAFQLLGQVAAQEMFANPAVMAGAMKFAEYIDQDRMNKVLGTEAATPAVPAGETKQGE